MKAKIKNADKLINLFWQYSDYLGVDDPEDRNLQLEFEEKFKDMICEINGHQIMPDQCGKPEHDFCGVCFKLKSDIVKAEK